MRRGEVGRRDKKWCKIVLSRSPRKWRGLQGLFHQCSRTIGSELLQSHLILSALGSLWPQMKS